MINKTLKLATIQHYREKGLIDNLWRIRAYALFQRDAASSRMGIKGAPTDLVQVRDDWQTIADAAQTAIEAVESD